MVNAILFLFQVIHRQGMAKLFIESLSLLCGCRLAAEKHTLVLILSFQSTTCFHAFHSTVSGSLASVMPTEDWGRVQKLNN